MFFFKVRINEDFSNFSLIDLDADSVAAPHYNLVYMNLLKFVSLFWKAAKSLELQAIASVTVFLISHSLKFFRNFCDNRSDARLSADLGTLSNGGFDPNRLITGT